MSEPDYQKLQADVLEFAKAKYRRDTQAHRLETVTRLDQQIELSVKEFKEYISRHTEEVKKLPIDERTMLKKQTRDFATRGQAYTTALKAMAQEWESATETFQKLQDDPKEHTKYAETIDRILDSLKPYESIGIEACTLLSAYKTAILNANDRAYEADKTELAEKMRTASPDELPKLQEYLDFLEEMHGFDCTTRELMKSHENSTRTFGGFANEEATMLAEIEKLSTEGYEKVFKPTEAIARIVDATGKVWLQAPNQNMFPPTQAEIPFLLTFTHAGKPLFRKQVEKYTLGLEMQADRYPASAVSKVLRDATNFRYKGKNYSWPESQFRFKGHLPYARENTSK